MIDLELPDPHHVTAGYTGVPGDRTFFVQAEDTEQRVTVLVEKQQVGGLAQLLAQLLARVEDEPATDWDRDAMALREPIDPRFRVGDVSVGVDPERGRFLIDLAELTNEEDEPRELRIWADQDQARRLAAHAAEIVGEGRPTCELCGRPTALDGSHVCPATNGHGRVDR
ncbi:MAG: DUF3090 family protein [Actinobacteria bacterium]|nr:DUF3090 family protein [Actinomycetota bacterium]